MCPTKVGKEQSTLPNVQHEDYKSRTPSELATAQRETRLVTARHADPADQAAAEYERGCHKLRRTPDCTP